MPAQEYEPFVCPSPITRARTTYSDMTDWMGYQGKRIPDNQLVEYAGMETGWQPAKKASERDPVEAAGDPYYQKYLQLSKNIAYKFPNPGPPKAREGRVGASWRHVKEVLGYGGSRVIFVDGMVKLYDMEVARMAKATPGKSLAYCPSGKTPVDADDIVRDLPMSQSQPKPYSYSSDPAPKLSASQPIYHRNIEPRGKYKGHYSYNKY